MGSSERFAAVPVDKSPSRSVLVRPYTVYETHSCAPSLYEFRTAHILSWIDRRLAGIESDLGDDETMQSLGLHGRVKLHERRATLRDVRAELERAS